MTNSEELEELLHIAYSENIFEELISEVNKSNICDTITISKKLEIYQHALEHVRRDKAI